MNNHPWLLPIIKQINTQGRNSLNNNLKKFEITDAQLEMLMFLKHSEEKSINQRCIENKLHLSNPTVVSLLDKLERKGLIVRSVSESDHRKKKIDITELGKKMCDALHDDFCEAEMRLTKGLSERDLEHMHDCLKMVLKNALANKEDKND